MRTLRRRACVRGRGLFSGRPVAVHLLPGTDRWRWGTRADRLHPLQPTHLSPLPHRSRLLCGDDVVTLPEHVLAALVLLDVDAVDVVFEGAEAPIGDGSAGAFVSAIRAAGLSGRRGSSLRVSTDEAGWSGGHEPGRARTFVRRGDAGRLRSMFPGARPGCAVVVDGSAALYGGRAPMPCEQPTHKLLDLLGDLGPWRAAGPLTGCLHVGDPRHIDNPAAIALAFDRGEVRRR